VSAGGLYTAPGTVTVQQAVTVTATSTADSTKKASAMATLQPPVAVAVSPGTATLTASQSQQFTATVTGTANTAVTWGLSPAVGTVSAGGLYTAPGTVTVQQTVTVTATSVADPAKTGSAAVTLLPPSAFTPIRVNAGGGAYTDPGGNLWAADTGYNGGLTYAVSAGIANTATPVLYRSVRYSSSPLQYQFGGIPAGTYTVKLKFAEIYFGSPGQRVFNIALNSQTVQTGFDVVVAAGGAYRAIDLSFPVTVSAGQIVILLTPVVENPNISAIEIVAAGGNPIVLSASPVSASLEPSQSRRFAAKVAAAGGTASATLAANATGTTAGTATITAAGPRPTGLFCSPATLVVSGSTSCTVSISGPAPAGGATVALSATGTVLSVPAEVLVTAGATSATFAASAGTIDTVETAAITASAWGGSASQWIELRPVQPAALACAAATLNAGSPLVCRVSLNTSAYPTPVTVQLRSSSSAVRVPASITFSRGRSRLVFFAYSSAGVPTQTVRLSAAANAASIDSDVTVLGSPATALRLPGAQTVMLGEVVRFQVEADDSGGSPLVATVSGLPLGAKFEGSSGVFEWKPRPNQEGRHSLEFSAADSENRVASGLVIVDVVPATPRLETMANAASLSHDAVCSPGSAASISGSGFALQSRAPYAVRVMVNGQETPLRSVSASRIWFQCPDLPAGSELSVAVRTPAGASNELWTTMREATPGIFTLDGSGQGQGSILLAGTQDFVVVRNPDVPGAPAQWGDVVTILATGLGPSVGGLAPARPFARIGGVPAEVLDARRNELTPGLYEVDVKIPAAVQAGELVPVVLEVPGLDGRLSLSNTVTIAIEEDR
jgi:uncharacterized protein (TIGR03437 family)